MSLTQHDKERNLSEKKNLVEYLEKEAERALQGECLAQRRLSQADSDIFCETNHQLGSQRLEFSQANHWADQAQRENSRSFGELRGKNRINQESHAKDCQEIEELRRVCCEEAKEAPLPRMSFLSQIQEQQDKSVNDVKEFYDPETASSSGPSQWNDQPRLWIAAQYTALDGYTRKRF